MRETLRIAGVCSVLAISASAFAGSDPAPTFVPTPVPPPIVTPPPYVPPVAPPVAPPPVAPPVTPPVTNLPPTTGGFMEFAITPFVNMEHGIHVFEDGYRAVCADQQGVVASSIMSIDAAIDGEPAEGQGAYDGLIIRPQLQYLRPGATSGSCQMTICLDGNIANASAPAACKDVQSFFREDSERAIDFKGNVRYQVANGGISLQTGAPGLSAYHPVFAFAAPNKAFKDFQSPIVLDLNGDGTYSLTDSADRRRVTRFDMTNEGRVTRTGWVDARDGFLAMDLNGNGRIDNGGELFGEYFGGTTRGPKTFHDGFEALASLDGNRDGVIDARDAAYFTMVVWTDANQDGVTQSGELRGLANVGVKSVMVNGTPMGRRDHFPMIAGNELRMSGHWIATDGSTRDLADVYFRARRMTENVAARVKWLMSNPGH